MLDNCLVTLAKSGKLLTTLIHFIKFLKTWQGVSKYANKIFLYLETNCLLLEPETKLPFELLFKTQKNTNF